MDKQTLGRRNAVLVQSTELDLALRNLRPGVGLALGVGTPFAGFVEKVVVSESHAVCKDGRKIFVKFARFQHADYFGPSAWAARIASLSARSRL